MNIFDLMHLDGIVPLRSHPDPEVLCATADWITDAGLSTFEITLRTPGAIDAIRAVAEHIGPDADLVLGAGTVLSGTDATAAIDAGATFVISPSLVRDVAAACADAGVPYVPGCATPTEVHSAIDLGCDVVKLFPASSLGPSFLSAVRSVFPSVRAIPTGGLTFDPFALAPWFDAGAIAVGFGSALFPPNASNRLTEAVGAVAQARTPT